MDDVLTFLGFDPLVQSDGEEIVDFMIRERSYLKRCMALIAFNGETVRGPFPSFQIPVPEDVVIPDTVTEEARERVIALAAEESTEANLSSEDPTSIHYLWGFILQGILRTRPNASRLRAVYKWGLDNPFINGERQEKPDFSFIPATRSHLNWHYFSGALEAKSDPVRSPSELSSSGSMASGGKRTSTGPHQALRKALRRCVQCVFVKWRAAGYAGSHRAYCCFADGLRFGVVRLQLDETSVKVDQYGPIGLPGSNSNTDDPQALRVLAHLLSAPPEVLHDLLSPSHEPFDIAATVSGREEEPNGPEGSFELGSFLGSGSFGTVYADAADPVGRIVKLGHKDAVEALQREMDTLGQLAHVSLPADTLFPKLVSALFVPEPNGAVLALKVAPRAVPLTRYLRCTDLNADELTTLARRLGAALVGALQAAHAVSVAHCDVRAENTLLVPPPSALSAIVNADGDLIAESDTIGALPLSECQILLNDWGSARSLSISNREQRTRDDLLALVGELQRLPSFKRPPASVELVAPPPHLRLPPTTVAELEDAAQRVNYDDLATRIKALMFV